jgi:transcriptional regulator with XRE-family HTH domain
MRSAQDVDLLRALAAELRARRIEAKVSQEELAHRAGMNRTFIGKIEIGINQPSITSFFCLASGLGITPAELIQGVSIRYEKELKSRVHRG